ncbi:NAD(P)-dependent dehydrogenase (short-subunit alcohol dehydrogenase family) [Lipingzhangella halophila]|uniref:NAD(P)-dependent dehydrogenase (Short-subunit alcohol dehydrogenase family) n=1 Tax=Lipingzhangella halophila TaxID=1783352 RepID=A0A7W7RDM1_9ACTN|nr:SDR family NAD(P)-dependent oxidoreductase [Lipingzhangella halophila]MBB4930051.1 NAD(P)-dependent dehydrogenase (short-subunit alcohol dehydrogenase family) [Lipingzhangella halophila]
MALGTLENLSGRAVIVTGASGAFGSGTLSVLRHLGANAIGIDRKPDDGVLGCDVTDGEQVREVVPEAIDRLGGRLDRLIHFAGVGPAVDLGAEPDANVYDALEVNLLGTWRVTAAALPALVRDRGRVLVVASLLAGLPVPFAGAYVVSKRALTAYADSLRAEYGMRIGVTTVYPGYVDTPIHDRSRDAGVALDGLVPAEKERDTVMTVLRAAAATRPKRDVASTRLGQSALRFTRHAPRIVDWAVTNQLSGLVRAGHFSDAEIARGFRERLGVPGHPETT